MLRNSPTTPALGVEFVDALPGGVFLVDQDLRLEFAGGASLAAAGWDAASLVGCRVDEVLPAAHAEILVPRYRAALAGERQIFDLPGERIFSVEIFPRLDADGVVTGAYALAHDVTERRSEERVVSEQLGLAFAQAPIGMALVALDGRWIEANPAICRLLGYSADELRAMTFQDVTHPDDLEGDLENLRRLIDAEISSYRMEKRYVTREGEIVWVHLTVGVVRDLQGNPLHLVSQIADITEQKRVEEQLRETQRLESLGLLAGGIAHDFNNLLVGVLGNASLALAELPEDSPARRRIETIELAAQRAGALTRQMLAYSGRGKFSVEQIDLSREASELRQLLAGAVPEGAEIRLDLAPGLPSIEGDVSQIRQVVMNLITNAAEAVEGGGVVVVKTGCVRADRRYLADFRFAEELPEGDYVSLEVADNGIGMDAATMAKIFDPFFTTKFTGRGLGLAAVLGIVRGHGGALKIYSELGTGSSFKVLFPAVAAVAAAEPEPASRRHGTGTILVVDDEDVVRDVSSCVLVQAGHRVLTAASGVEAVRVMAERPDEIAIVLLDLTMPGQPAEDTVEQLRGLRPDVTVLLMSGYNEQVLGERLAGSAIAGFIQKPYGAAQLTELVDRALSA